MVRNDGKVIAVDFDGTIVEHAFPAIGNEMLFAFDTLKALQKKGHKLILWTYRDGDLLEEAVVYCKEKGIEFYQVNSTISCSCISHILKAPTGKVCGNPLPRHINITIGIRSTSETIIITCATIISSPDKRTRSIEF